MLGPAIFVIVDSFLEKDRIAGLIAEKKHVPFGRNCQTVNLPLFARFWVIVIPFNFEDGSGPVRIRIDFRKAFCDLVDFVP